jgi:hypothetical protein
MLAHLITTHILNPFLIVNTVQGVHGNRPAPRLRGTHLYCSIGQATDAALPYGAPLEISDRLLPRMTHGTVVNDPCVRCIVQLHWWSLNDIDTVEACGSA